MTELNGITVPVDEVLERLDHGRKWVQGDWANDNGMCLHQGIRLCQEQKGDAFIIEQVARVQGWGTDFNDDKDTTFDDVKQRLVEHREILPHELEEVFGPQWSHIVALVRRAAVLTEGEARALVPARDAAWNAAWDAAWDAARDAARALVVRDLIGDVFTQDHYDLLTQPWASVIGPVHPEDERTAANA